MQFRTLLLGKTVWKNSGLFGGQFTREVSLSFAETTTLERPKGICWGMGRGFARVSFASEKKPTGVKSGGVGALCGAYPTAGHGEQRHLGCTHKSLYICICMYIYIYICNI